MGHSFLDLPAEGLFVGRIWRRGVGPSIVTVRSGAVFDVTSPLFPTVSALLESDDLPAVLAGLPAEAVGPLDQLAEASLEAARSGDPDATRILAPCDLQAVKACGVTFARSMIERVIEERAGGDPGRADDIRSRVSEVVGERLRDLVPGSEAAAEVKRVLQAEGLWSQYLEVGIGPDAEVFTKCPPMAAVGWGSDVGGRRTPWIVGGMAALCLGGFGTACATALAAHHLAAGLALAVLAFLTVGMGAGAAGT